MNVYRCSQHRSRCPTVSDVSCALLCARKTLLHPERYYPHARIRVFHHSGPEIPGSAREGKPRSFFLCFRADLRDGRGRIQYARGHKYLTLVYQIDDLTRLLWVGQERTVTTFEKFFDMIGAEIASGIEFVCSDMWKPYLKVIREKCSQALHVLDRFHIVAKMNDAVDDVRAEEARKMRAAGHETLKHTRWCLLKRKQNLTPDQRFRLRDLLHYNLRTVRAYLLKEDFQQFWDYDSPTWAGKFLDDWVSAD